ncbi:MAG: hypothetical protein GY860_23395 [Desulfobacteraceae bacterium]|nr:hypothetical protein [Desulfobacteraceae bacterium]
MELKREHIDGLVKKYVKETLESEEDERLMLGPIPAEVQEDIMADFEYFKAHSKDILRTNNLKEIEPWLII